MCTTCGCQNTEKLLEASHTEHHHHNHLPQSIELEKAILETNTYYAQRNKKYIEDKKSILLNFVSSPGSGKTSLLVQSIKDLSSQYPISVIEGDQYTQLDADRIREAGAQAYQINTGKACHLDAHMISHAFEHLTIQENGFVLIENVGNLICPALFDLGENKRVVLISVTEGDDKPLKYPDMFFGADLVIVNKTDLLAYVDFDMQKLKDNIHKVQPKANVISVSVKQRDNLDSWYQWLEGLLL
ncbi:hydrogenase nickel incorporation protein HypB [Thiotrichales bacterium 19S3-7]|nr:hydrogenase nickel incorporation protein HypB [Thiotrichales bacterium 19S3-7]MCF6802066.1 hydrogenase nickel incorporation protein HypB [Thiotrichales bacterium 19S3-11]